MTASPPATTRASRAPVAILLGVALLLGLALIIFRPASYVRGVEGDPRNPDPNGSMALAEVLRDHGVDLRVTDSVSTALASQPEVLVISDVSRLAPHQARALAQVPADVVLVGVTRPVPGFLEELTIDRGAGSSPLAPGCTDPRASAGNISTTAPILTSPGAGGCFPGPDSGVMLTWGMPSGNRGTVLPTDLTTNALLAEEANAALAVRVVGEAADVTWLVGRADDPYGMSEPGEAVSLRWLWSAIGVLFIALIWWRGPRFGRLSSEPLPVVVDASETTVGRGRLYRRSGDLPHAAASLRLGSLTRIAPRVGLSPTASAQEVTAGVARASRRPPSQVAALLYGPAPRDSHSLHALALALDELEDEVDHV